jgi:hypothetical protein
VLFLTVIFCPPQTPASVASPIVKGKKTKLTGRVLATRVILRITKNDPQQFIFGVESKDRRGNVIVSPVFVNYSDATYRGLLPEDFFDYSKKYELSVIKQKNNVSFKDEIINKSFSFADVTLQGLEIRDGVPKSILNMNMDIMLPLYELSTKKHEIIKEKSKNNRM